MIHNKKQVPASRIAILMLVLVNVLAIIEAYTTNENWYWVLVITLPLLFLAIANIRRKKHVRNYPVSAHSEYPIVIDQGNLRVWIGNEFCKQPYSASIYNIGAMSNGALSKTVISELNAGARLGGFAYNTGEGGIAECHLNGGDLIWQIGTGYVGCRDEKGRFNAMAFRKNALRAEVKMIELKISQGAKPGHEGFLPERHTEFDSHIGMVMFLDLLRELSDGKPVGFKICIRQQQEFIEICNAIKATGYIPDFISVEDGEVDTVATHLKITAHPGMPLYEALAFVKQTLTEFDLARHIKILAAGKIITGFHVLKALSLGASACYGPCEMMFAFEEAVDKAERVVNYHGKVIKAAKEIMEACGFSDVQEIPASKFFRRTDRQKTGSI